MNPFSTLRTNIGLFPKFAALVAAVYVLVGLAIAVSVGIHYHSASQGVAVAVLVLFLCVLFDFIAYYAIAANPVWFSRCREFADAFARIFLTERLDSPSEECDGDEDWEENYGENEPDEESDYKDYEIEEGDFIEDDFYGGEDETLVEDENLAESGEERTLNADGEADREKRA